MLTENQLKALKTILNVNSKICVGGSICLKAYGLMDREVGDLDLFVDRSVDLDFSILENYVSQDENPYELEVTDRIGMDINGIKVDLFRVDSYLISSTPWRLQGVDVQMQNPCLAIAAKVKYSETTAKHVVDIEELRIKFLKLSGLI